jgi:hypothetical protein
MGVTYNPRIVTDGLVLALDAGNTKSYPGSGTTFYDLSGKEHNFTATTISTASDATAGTVYDHDNSTAATLNITPNINHEVWSLMFWVRSTGTTPSNYRSILRLEDTSSIPVYFYNFDTRETTNCRVLGYQKHYDGTVSNNQWMTRDFNTGSAQWLTGDWFCFGVSHNNTAFRNYRNGQLFSTQTQTFDVTGYGDIDRIIININNDNTVRMGPVLLYDRILTDAEFEQNFNATRGRFGI